MKLKAYMPGSSHQVNPFTFTFSFRIRSSFLNRQVSCILSSNRFLNCTSPDWVQKRYVHFLICELTSLSCTTSLLKCVCCYKRLSNRLSPTPWKMILSLEMCASETINNKQLPHSLYPVLTQTKVSKRRLILYFTISCFKKSQTYVFSSTQDVI